ncbi:MAG: GntR family transcriptional regulator, partial [Thermomicrobiales bacterium]
MDTPIAVVTAEPLRDRAEAVLRDAIVSGQLLPGTRLVEVQLSERLGVSRGTLRQALRELEHAGLVVSVPYRGTYVAEQTPNVLRDAYALRGLLEGFAATQIPPEAVPGIVSTQRALIQQMRNALDT